MNPITTAPAPSTKKTGLFINRNFALLWTGGAISVFGDGIFDTSLVVWISVFLAAHQSWAPLAVSGVLLAMLVPTFVFGPIAGVFVDRWDKRRTMLWMDAIRAVLIALLLLATNSVPLPFLPGGSMPLTGQLAAIYTVVFLTSLCTQFFSPARMALLGDIVPDSHRAHASGMTQVTPGLAMIIAPPLAPILLLAVGAQVALLINALSFVCSFLLLLVMRTPKAASSHETGESPHMLHEFVAGLRFSLQNRVVLTLIITASLVMFGASALNALDIFFVLNNLHASVNLYGFLTTAQGVGAILGAILAGMFARRIGLVRTLTGSLLAVGIGILIYSRLTSFVPALIVITFIGIFMAALNIAVGPLLLRVTPRAYIGRVMATLNPTSALIQVLGTILAGYLSSNILLNLHVQTLGMTFGPTDTIFTAGAVLILLGAAYAMLRLGFTDPQSCEEKTPIAASSEPVALAVSE